MSQTTTVWLVLLLSFFAANAPFFNQRFLLIVKLKTSKSLGTRVFELVLFYFLVGAIALLFENRVGQITSQGWEFYAITATLFITMAFPGFVYRYLLKHQS